MRISTAAFTPPKGSQASLRLSLATCCDNKSFRRLKEEMREELVAVAAFKFKFPAWLIKSTGCAPRGFLVISGGRRAVNQQTFSPKPGANLRKILETAAAEAAAAAESNGASLAVALA